MRPWYFMCFQMNSYELDTLEYSENLLHLQGSLISTLPVWNTQQL